MKSLLTAIALIVASAAVTVAESATKNAYVGVADQGKSKSATCSACHGSEGNSAAADYPKLAGQHASYLASTLRAYRDGSRENAIMNAWVMRLSRGPPTGAMLSVWQSRKMLTAQAGMRRLVVVDRPPLCMASTGATCAVGRVPALAVAAAVVAAAAAAVVAAAAAAVVAAAAAAVVAAATAAVVAAAAAAVALPPPPAHTHLGPCPVSGVCVSF